MLLGRALVAAVVVVTAAGCSRSHEAPRALERAGAAVDRAAPDRAAADRAAADRAAAMAPLSCRTLEGCTDACADARCAEDCVRRLTAAARPAYDALQACVVPACTSGSAGAAPCRAPGSFACKMCVLSHCAAEATACMAH